MKLFDFVKLLFNGTSNEYEQLSNYQRSKNSFMVRRFMSINYPETANLLNKNKLNPIYVNDSFRLIARGFKRTPNWIFTKTKTVKSTEVFEPNEETIKYYLKQNNATMKDYKDILKSKRKDDMLLELEKLEQYLEETGYKEN